MYKKRKFYHTYICPIHTHPTRTLVTTYIKLYQQVYIMRTYAYVFCEHHQCTEGLSELQNKPGVVIKVLNVPFIASVK